MPAAGDRKSVSQLPGARILPGEHLAETAVVGQSKTPGKRGMTQIGLHEQHLRARPSRRRRQMHRDCRLSIGRRR